MTYPDRTVYPVATQNLADFYNLVDVYMDAVFHPRLEKEVFLQEGWHYELSPARDGVTYKGVVFNEMKGVYSSPDSVNHTWMQASLFPDSVYAHSSGGDPAIIPDLTYADFVGFHKKNYHPSNSMVFFYGDDDEGKRLDVVDSYFAEYSNAVKSDAITWQKPLKAPLFVKKPYPGAPSQCDSQSDSEEGGESESKHFLTVGWVLNHGPGELADVDRLAWTTLNVLLTGTDTAPLKKALMDTGVGEALTGYGFEDDLLQATYSVGLKGISNKDDVAKVEPIVQRVLSELAESGFTEDHVAAALNTIEFQLREFATDADTPK
jgi:presequence protease